MTEFEADLMDCLEVLRAGGTILYPTDTIWGIGCDATRSDAVQKVYDLKKRSDEKSLIVLVAENRDILQFVAAPDPAITDFLRQVTRPTTVIYDDAVGLAPNLVQADGSIGIRVVKDDFCRHLVKRFRKPIVSTSANISGQPAPRFFSEIDPVILQSVDYVVKHRQDEHTLQAPSSVIRWQRDGSHQVIRS